MEHLYKEFSRKAAKSQRGFDLAVGLCVFAALREKISHEDTKMSRRLALSEIVSNQGWRRRLRRTEDVFVSSCETRYFSRNRGISSTKLQGRLRLSSCSERIRSQPSFTAPFEPGSAKM